MLKCPYGHLVVGIIQFVGLLLSQLTVNDRGADHGHNCRRDRRRDDRAPTVVLTIASCKRRLRHPLVVVTQAVVKNKERMQHMHVATTLCRRRAVRNLNALSTLRVLHGIT